MDAAPGRMVPDCANGHKLRLSRASSCWSLRRKKWPGRGKRKKCLGLPHPRAQLDRCIALPMKPLVVVRDASLSW